MPKVTLQSRLRCSLLGFHGLKVVEAINWDVLYEAVKLVFLLLVFVPLASDSNTDLARDISNAINPHVSVEVSVDSNFFSVHSFLCEPLDVTDGARSSLIELEGVENLVHVQGVVTAGRLHFSFTHLFIIIINYD